MLVDLGCGGAKLPGAIGVDNVALPGVDIVHDLQDFPYPFEDSSVREAHLNHVIEHFSFRQIQAIFDELFRIIEPAGLVHVRVPHVFSIAAWADPTHRMSFTFESGQFFDSNAPKAYYKELDFSWQLVATSSRVTWFNWKRYRLRKLDAFISQLLAKLLNVVLKRTSFPGSADLIVKLIPIFFVEIHWVLRKVDQD